MAKFKKPYGLSTLKMDFDTESYIDHRIEANKPLILTIILDLPAERKLNEEWHQACHEQTKWEMDGKKGTYNQREYDAAFAREERTTSQHYETEGKRVQAMLAPIIQNLGGTVVSDHRIDPANGEPWYGEMCVQFDSLEAVKAFATNKPVREITSSSERTHRRFGRDMALMRFRRRFSSRFASPGVA